MATLTLLVPPFELGVATLTLFEVIFELGVATLTLFEVIFKLGVATLTLFTTTFELGVATLTLLVPPFGLGLATLTLLILMILLISFFAGQSNKKTSFAMIITSFGLQGTGLTNLNPTEMENPQRVSA